jgi:hypothetical protein
MVGDAANQARQAGFLLLDDVALVRAQARTVQIGQQSATQPDARCDRGRRVMHSRAGGTGGVNMRTWRLTAGVPLDDPIPAYTPAALRAAITTGLSAAVGTLRGSAADSECLRQQRLLASVIARRLWGCVWVQARPR